MEWSFRRSRGACRAVLARRRGVGAVSAARAPVAVAGPAGAVSAVEWARRVGAVPLRGMVWEAVGCVKMVR